RAGGPQLPADLVELGTGGQLQVVQQVGGLLEAGVRGQVGDVVAGVEELAPLAVDVGDPGPRGDHALKALALTAVSHAAASGRHGWVTRPALRSPYRRQAIVPSTILLVSRGGRGRRRLAPGPVSFPGSPPGHP